MMVNDGLMVVNDELLMVQGPQNGGLMMVNDEK